jgi:O-antigen/teichoic acid export membrane protein
VPVAVFFIGFFNILNYFNIRKKYYKDIAKATIVKSIILSIIQLTIGFFKQGAGGLITGQIISQIFINIKLFKNILKDKKLISSINKLKIFAIAKKYKSFPKFSTWAVLANTLSQHLTNIIIPIFYSTATLGFYSLIQRVLVTPSSIIGNSIGLIFFKQAMLEKQNTGTTKIIFYATLKNLFIIATPIYVILYFTIEDLFMIVFGDNWKEAGSYAKILIFMYYIRFIVSSVANMNEIFKKNHILLYWQIGLLTINILLLLTCNHFNIIFANYLYYLNIIISFYYLILLFIMSRYNEL